MGGGADVDDFGGADVCSTNWLPQVGQKATPFGTSPEQVGQATLTSYGSASSTLDSLGLQLPISAPADMPFECPALTSNATTHEQPPLSPGTMREVTCDPVRCFALILRRALPAREALIRTLEQRARGATGEAVEASNGSRNIASVLTADQRRRAAPPNDFSRRTRRAGAQDARSDRLIVPAKPVHR